jgi:DNA-directed RNA polymerase subunit RPC12/RpoP
MKCIHCGTDSKLRERTDKRCPRCKHPFAFEPTTDSYKVTDGQFKNAVDRVSGTGKVQFTERELWYEFNRRWMRPGFWRSPFGVLPFAGAGSALLAVGNIIHIAVVPMALIGVGAGLVTGALLSKWTNDRAPLPPRPPRIAFAEFRQQYLRRWREVHGDVAGLLPVREMAIPDMPKEVPADVAAFSFDRAVVTDTWQTAQMLVANRFHFEHNCAVLSRDGYPDGIADTVKEMLRRNPRLTVFALHDASPGGCLLPLTLRDAEWFPDPAIRIVDLGLRPGTARKLRVPALAGPPTQLPPRLAEILPAEDVAWLAEGHVAELAALRPEQVLRAAYQGIVAAGPSDGSSGGDGSTPGNGGDTYHGGGVIWVGDLSPGVDTAAVDGFG